MELFYHKPASVWTEGNPIGCGRLGAVVYGRYDHEIIQTVANRVMEFKGGKLTDYLGTYDDFIESRRGK